MTTDIVIVNWNAGRQLQDCVESVRAFSGGLVGTCIVVDNGSSDGSVDFLQDASDVVLVRAGFNLGFAKACNLGAQKGTSNFILFLNPDARLLAQSLPGACAYLDNPSHSDIGIVGVQLVGADGELQRTCARFPTAARLAAKSFGLTAMFKTLDFQMKEWPHNEIRRVDQVIGAFFLVHRALHFDLGGFDERFFVYFEEVDFSYRASKLGYQSVYLADVQAFHKGGGVSEQVKAHRLFYSLRSRILYAHKHFAMSAAFSIAIATLIVEPMTRLAFLCLGGRLSEVPDLLRGYRMLWKWVIERLVGAKT